MRLFLSAASALALIPLSAVAKDAVAYDLWKSTEAGKSVIAVAATGDKAPFAVASGADAAALDVLAADDASLAIADLRARSAEKALPEGDAVATAPTEPAPTDKTAEVATDPAGARKIVLIKEVRADKDGADKKETTEVRRIIKLNADDDMADADLQAMIEDAKTELKGADAGSDVKVEQGAIAADDADAALLAAAKGERVIIVENDVAGAKTRLVSIAGADADGARAFIDQAEGLDDAEKKSMRKSLGL